MKSAEKDNISRKIIAKMLLDSQFVLPDYRH